VLLTYNENRDKLQDHLLDRGIPLVTNARSLSEKSASYVDVDNEQGSYSGVRHLLDKGCRVVATVAPHQGISPGVDRLNGYRRAMAEAGLEHGDDLIRFGDFTSASGRQLTAELLAGRPDIDGLFVAGQLMSYGALRARGSGGSPFRERRTYHPLPATSHPLPATSHPLRPLTLHYPRNSARNDRYVAGKRMVSDANGWEVRSNEWEVTPTAPPTLIRTARYQTESQAWALEPADSAADRRGMTGRKRSSG
jgi:hypothetical protein